MSSKEKAKELTRRGMVHAAKREVYDAVKAFYGALELRPDDKAPRLELSKLLGRTDEWNEVLRALRDLKRTNALAQSPEYLADVKHAEEQVRGGGR